VLTVEKIGGTSMTKFKDVLHNIILRKSKPYNRVFVVSAYGGVTNWLLEDKKTDALGVYMKFVELKNYEKTLNGVLERLIAINRTFEDIKLDQNVADEYLIDRIRRTNDLLNSLAKVLSSGYVNKRNILLAAREILASIGEAHSAFNSVNILNNNGIKATFVDLSGFHDSDFLTIDERIKKSMQSINFSETVAIVTGYTKGTEGIMRSFDRGYSEITFSKIAVELKTDEAIIHKEYHLSSADPMIVGKDRAIPVGRTNYDVVDQLADLGMEAIHPKASKPLKIAGIDLRIKNTFEPDHPGTLIAKDFRGQEKRVEMVVGSDKVILIEVHDSLMVGEVGFDLGIMQIFQRHNISYIMKSTNANSISMVLSEEDFETSLIKDLEARYQAVTIKESAIVSAIGSNISQPGILARAATVLAKNQINIDCVTQSLRQVNMQFVIDRSNYQMAIRKLHEILCANQD